MTKEEFQQLQLQQKESGLGLMNYLKRESIPYSSYNYWNRKYSEETERLNNLPLAPIMFTDELPAERSLVPIGESHTIGASSIEGITVLLPNGIQAHFSAGMASAALQLLTTNQKSHVLPE